MFTPEGESLITMGLGGGWGCWAEGWRELGGAWDMFDHPGSCPQIPQTHMSGVGLPTFGAKQVAIAGDVAIGNAIMLGHKEREPSELGCLPIFSLPPPNKTTIPSLFTSA